MTDGHELTSTQQEEVVQQADVTTIQNGSGNNLDEYYDG